MYDDAVCVSTAVEINMLDYSITVSQHMAPYAVWTGLHACNATHAMQGLCKQRQVQNASQEK